MSQNLGKLSVGVAFLALAGGVGFAVAKKDARIDSAVLTKPATGAAFDATEPAALPEASLGWLKPQHVEGDSWTYDLFTPVEVSWLPKSSEYVPKGDLSGTVVQVENFGLTLLSLSHPKYRLRVSTIAESTTKAATDALIFLYDDESRSTLKGKIGETVGPKGNQVKILKYEPKQVDPKTGALLRNPTVTVKDLSLRRDMVLGQAPVEFKDRITIVFAAGTAPTPVWTATAVGEKFENESGVFTIKGVDFEGQTVTVEKSYLADPVKNKRKVISETLAPVPAVIAPKPDTKK